MAESWVGIDCGYSQMTIAILDEAANTVAVERTHEPLGDGHSRDVAIDRLRCLLRRLTGLRHRPVRLAGYCYEHSGVLEAFRDAGWAAEGCVALNDVVGLYGLTDMTGHALVCGCGSFPQVVYMSSENNVTWPGDDVVNELPKWLLSGSDYASFLLDLSRRATEELAWLPQLVQETLGAQSLEPSDHRWGALGPLLGRLVGRPELDDLMARAAEAVVGTRDVIWKHIGTPEPPRVLLGGGALRDEAIWVALMDKVRERGGAGYRVQGEPAIGLARFAARNPGVDAWAFLGRQRPSWLAQAP